MRLLKKVDKSVLWLSEENTKTIEKIRKSGIKYIIVWNNPENLPLGRNVDFDSNFYRNAFGLKKLFSAATISEPKPYLPNNPDFGDAIKVIYITATVT